MLLTHRKLLQSKAIAIENDLRATLRNFGLKVGMIGTVTLAASAPALIDVKADKDCATPVYDFSAGARAWSYHE